MEYNMEGISTSTLLSSSIDLAQKAISIVVEYSRSPLQPLYKAGNEVYTEADVEVQKLIQSTLQSLFPSVKIIGEEGDRYCPESVDSQVDQSLVDSSLIPPHYTSLDPSKVIVWIDPIDSTSQYIKGNLEPVSVLIGISYEGRPIIGVIGLPFSDSVYFSLEGAGIFVKQREIARIDVVHNENTRVLSGWVRPEHLFSQYYDFLIYKDVTRQRGCGPKGIAVGTGQFDILVYDEEVLCLWDVCAIIAFHIASGGLVCDLYGDPILFTEDRSTLLEKGAIFSRTQEQLEACMEAWRQFLDANPGY